MNENKTPFYIRTRPDKCPKCKKDNAIILVSNTGNSINYTSIIDKYPLDRLEDEVFLKTKFLIERAKCKYCKSIFRLDWRNHYPIPVQDPSIYKNFIVKKD